MELDTLKKQHRDTERQLFHATAERHRIQERMRQTYDEQEIQLLMKQKRKLRQEAKGVSEKVAQLHAQIVEHEKVGGLQTVQHKLL